MFSCSKIEQKQLNTWVSFQSAEQPLLGQFSVSGNTQAGTYEWTPGWGMGVSEHLVDDGNGNELIISCPDYEEDGYVRAYASIGGRQYSSEEGSGFDVMKGEKATAKWLEWQVERERLFAEEGQICFDLFAPKSSELLGRCQMLRELVADTHPVVIVDEAQDTGDAAWSCIEKLAGLCQIICLADLDQQIFDHLEGVGPERIEHIKDALDPVFVDLGSDNNRSPGTEIAVFGNDILEKTPRRAPYAGVGRILYDSRQEPVQWMRMALGRFFVSAKANGLELENIAILATTGRGVAKISAALNGGAKPIPHKVLFDERKRAKL
ncbi:hypothetical protein BN889_07162 [Pseudomonas aeruginosa PA38182]|nr:hypothetical protein BN889_07162 [Pseudomonas aeruginosa PA38182]